jgi:hypothetical protein
MLLNTAGSTPSPYQPNPEAIAVRRGGAHAGMEALVDDRVLRFEEQLFGEDRVSGIGHPSTHALSETPPKRCRHHPLWGYRAAAHGAAFDHPSRVCEGTPGKVMAWAPVSLKPAVAPGHGDVIGAPNSHK